MAMLLGELSFYVPAFAIIVMAVIILLGGCIPRMSARSFLLFFIFLLSGLASFIYLGSLMNAGPLITAKPYLLLNWCLLWPSLMGLFFSKSLSHQIQAAILLCFSVVHIWMMFIEKFFDIKVTFSFFMLIAAVGIQFFLVWRRQPR
jgi:hypothetical protein